MELSLGRKGRRNLNEWINKINDLDVSLFEKIPSQTSDGDRRSILAVQRVTAKKNKEYVYLEIGSHLGGSIQPHLVDDRCKRIYSIDARPAQQPDDRSPGYTAYYDDNSTDRMLNLLMDIGHGDVRKIKCFDTDASEVDLNQIEQKPQIAFIDGEHTQISVISDFRFCGSVLSDEGTILFHDFNIIYPAIVQICKQLDKQNRFYLPLKLEGDTFAIFFDGNLVNEDEYLMSIYRKNKYYLLSWRIKACLKMLLPVFMLDSLRRVRRMVTQKSM